MLATATSNMATQEAMTLRSNTALKAVQRALCLCSPMTNHYTRPPQLPMPSHQQQQHMRLNIDLIMDSQFKHCDMVTMNAPAQG